MKTFRDRVAVVTGAASGIGRALAERFVAEGMKVVLADIEEAPLQTLARTLADGGATVLPLRVDVAQAAEIEHLADAAYAAYGAVHVLCNNAGVGGTGRTWEVPVAEWEWVLGVDLWSVIHGIRSFVPRMRDGGDEGHVVNTASVAGLVAGPGMGPYNVSKFGVVALSETLHHELAMEGSKLKVSVLCPAWVATRIIDSDRNRPAAVAPPPSDPAADAMREMARGLVAGGLAPANVAERVRDAIRDERFYILTHPDFTPIVRARMEAVLAARNPSFGGFER